jgi:hypothetical protein
MTGRDRLVNPPPGELQMLIALALLLSSTGVSSQPAEPALGIPITGDSFLQADEEAASPFSYNYVEAQWGFVDIDGVAEDADLTSVSILADMVGGTFLRIESSGADYTSNAGYSVSASSLAIGLGFRRPLSDVIDIYGIGSYVKGGFSDSVDISGEGRGIGLAAGVRFRPAPHLELGAAYDWAKSSDGVDESVVSLTGFFDANDTVSIGARVMVHDDAEALTMGLRIHF